MGGTHFESMQYATHLQYITAYPGAYAQPPCPLSPLLPSGRRPHILWRGALLCNTTFRHQLFDMAIAQGIGHVPPHTHENDVCGEMGPFEADRHSCSPPLRTVAHRGRAYRKWPHMRIATHPQDVQDHGFTSGWKHDAIVRSRILTT